MVSKAVVATFGRRAGVMDRRRQQRVGRGGEGEREGRPPRWLMGGINAFLIFMVLKTGTKS